MGRYAHIFKYGLPYPLAATCHIEEEEHEAISQMSWSK